MESKSQTKIAGQDSHEPFEFDPPLKKCRLCGSPDLLPHYVDFRGIHISRCAACGVQFMNPQYSDAYLDRFYSQYGWNGKGSLELLESLQYCHHFYLSLIEKSAPKKGKLLDIGAGTGELVVAAKNRGWLPTGVDVEGEVTRMASQQWGIPYHLGDFNKITWEAESFDAVTLHQVLEHLKDPMSYLRSVHRLLKKDGVLFLAVPNIGALSARFKFLLERMGLRRKKRGYCFDTSHHLWYFTPESLEKTVQSLGFKTLHLRSGHQAREKQSKLKRFWMRHVTERLAWKSTFILIVRK